MVVPIFFIFSLILSSCYASMQDFCVAACKIPAKVTIDDFVYSGLGVSANTSNINKDGIITAFAAQLPGLNGLGLSMLRADYAPGGVGPMHIHRGASELILIVEGTLLSGFIATDNTVYQKILEKDDIMIVLQGLFHFQKNVGDTPAILFASFNSDNPGVHLLEDALFASNLSTELIAETTLLDTGEIKNLKGLLGGTN